MEQPILKDYKKTFSRIGLASFITFVVVQLVQIILSMGAVAINPDLVTKDWFQFFSITISFYLIGFPLFCLMVRKLPDGTVRESKTLPLMKIIQYGCMSYAILIIVNALTVWGLYLIQLLKGTSVVNPVSMVLDANPILTLLFVVIASPIIEELLFRKVMLNKLRDYGDYVAILVTAVTFGLYHGNFSQMFYATALGIVLAYVALKTNRIQYTIALHIFVNAMGSLVPLLLIGGSVFVQSVFSCLIIAIVVIGALLLLKKFKKASLLSGEIDIPKQGRWKIIWMNPGMISYIVVTVASSLMILMIA